MFVTVWPRVAVTVTVMPSVALAPFAKLPTFHSPVATLYVPWLGTFDTCVTPAGKSSLITMPVAPLGLAVCSSGNEWFLRYGVFARAYHANRNKPKTRAPPARRLSTKVRVAKWCVLGFSSSPVSVYRAQANRLKGLGL